eukprot:GILK01004916.1.p1 GENE.GILK01004916.1~~GILK01004916.1.p1  ORF type:complete len:213 (-),score=25.99 GILK01004916.1:112-672(-)
MAINALVVVANGSEEIEAICVIDTLRRAQVLVDVAAVGGSKQITASRGVVLVADFLLEEVENIDYNMIVLPGGLKGAENLRDSTMLISMLKKQRAAHRWIAAICAAPAVVLATHGLLEGHAATCYPTFANMLPDTSQIEQRVVVHKQLITSRAPGTALEFALKLADKLMGSDVAEDVGKTMLVQTM